MDPTNSFKVLNIPLLEKKEFFSELNELLRIHFVGCVPFSAVK